MDGTKKHTIRGNYQYWAKKAEQINAGKMVLSIRQWTGRPYNSEQEEIMQLHTLRVQAISINITDATPMVGVYGDTDKLLSAEEIEEMARNDGLCVEVLAEIADAVDSSMKIFVDGGIRSGTDVFKALALGADAAIIARPFVTAVYGGGREGVESYVQKISSELADTMAMCGVSSLSEITRDCIRR